MRKLLLVLSVAGLVVGSAGVASAVNLLVDGDLDAGSGATIPGWSMIETKTFSGPTTDLITDESFIEIPPITNGGGDLDKGGFVKAFQGNLTTGDLATLHFYQDVPGVAGLTYQLTAMIGAGTNYSGLLNGPTKTQLAIDFLNASSTVIGGNTLDVKAAGLTSGTCCAFGAQQFSVTAAAPAGTAFVRARFSGIDMYNTQNPDPSAFVDDFNLSTNVPEPASLALGLSGIVGLLGLAGGARRR